VPDPQPSTLDIRSGASKVVAEVDRLLDVAYGAPETALSELERASIYVLRRERRPDGGERIYYRPGPVMLRELAAFSADYPKDKPKVLPPVPAAKTAARAAPRLNPPLERVAGPLAERLSMEPDQEREPDPDPREPSSSCERARARPPETALDEEEQPTVSKEDREIARWALGERMKRKHPKRTPPRWFDRHDVEMVARCVAAVDGDRAAKEQAQREAIAGAFCISRDGPPTARFVWEKLEHFFEHVERGHTKLRNEALEAQRRQREREEEADRPRSIGSWRRVARASPRSGARPPAGSWRKRGPSSSRP